MSKANLILRTVIASTIFGLIGYFAMKIAYACIDEDSNDDEEYFFDVEECMQIDRNKRTDMIGDFPARKM